MYMLLTTIHRSRTIKEVQRMSNAEEMESTIDLLICETCKEKPAQKGNEYCSYSCEIEALGNRKIGERK